MLKVDEPKGLTGYCDYLISRSPRLYYPESPIVAVVEAKREDLNAGLGQCRRRDGGDPDLQRAGWEAGSRRPRSRDQRDQLAIHEAGGAGPPIDLPEYFLRDLAKILESSSASRVDEAGWTRADRPRGPPGIGAPAVIGELAVAYNNFDLRAAVQKFGLSRDESSEPVRRCGGDPAERLPGRLAGGFCPARALRSIRKQAQREFIIAPVLAEAKRRSPVAFNVFPGVALTVDTRPGGSAVSVITWYRGRRRCTSSKPPSSPWSRPRSYIS